MATSFESADAARADIADLLDLQLAPLGLAAMDALGPAVGKSLTGQTILDVGCGAGGTLTQLAQRVGTSGRVIGVDIGPRSLAVAQSRTRHLPQVTLLNDDAATLNLADSSVDGVFSRFGVMFFDDPVSAFANFHRMLRPGGCIGFVCWRSWIENELDVLPVEAAALDIAIDDTPFSFERPDDITDVLQASGFGRIAVRAFDTSVSCGGVDATVKVLIKVGALGKMLRETPELRAIAEPRVRAALVALGHGTEVRLGAATWIVTAVAG